MEETFVQNTTQNMVPLKLISSPTRASQPAQQDSKYGIDIFAKYGTKYGTSDFLLK
jgi:hypothetical protein